MSLAAVLARLDADRVDALDRLMELLRIPSISTDPQFKGDCATAADWLVADLTSIGFDLTRSTIDDRFRPTKGTRTEMAVEQFGLLFGD